MNTEIKEILLGVRRTLKLIDKPEIKALILASGIMVITGFLTNLPAVILGKLVDALDVAQSFSFGSVFPFIAGIIVLILIREVLTVWRKYNVENVATQTEKKQTVATVAHILEADSLSLDTMRVGTLHGRMFRSIEGLVKIIKLSFLEFLPTIFTAIAALIIAMLQKPLIAGVMLLVIPAGLFIITKQISSQKGIRVQLLRGKEQIDGSVVEVLGGLETVRSLDTTKYEVERIEDAAEKLRVKEIVHHIQMALYDAGKYLNEGFFYILVICLSIYLASQGIITKGDILVYSILFMSVLNPLREVHRILDEAHENSIRVNDLYELQSMPKDQSYEPIISESNSKKTDIAIQIDNLSYRYASRQNHAVLNKINLTVKRGEKIGIAGVSGGGKSTFVKILLRLQHNYEGNVTLLGSDLLTLSRKQLAQRLAYIPQRTYIFSGTIRENIVYGSGKGKSNDKTVIEAAKKAHIWEEIEQSLGGLDGKVTEQGNNLSGGQKQRLAIARIIFHAPDIIIFDEATSALDNQNEAEVQKMLEAIFADKTVITIAHRLTTLRNSDRILVFADGQIAQEGSYKQLAHDEGIFKKFLEQK
jgi:ATP-binding cassette subfamily B protein